jgi:preprotein translocase subunit YajC
MLALIGEQAQQGSLIGMFIPMILVFAVFYFLLIRPQQKQAKQHTAMLGNLRVGDEVITRSGFHGRMHGIDGLVCTVEIANNVRVQMNKDQVATVKNAESKGTSVTTAA